MIRFYPSRLEGEPLETHEIGGPIKLEDWLRDIVGQEISDRTEHPINVDINGDPCADFSVVIGRDDIVDIYPNVLGIEAGVLAIIAVVVSVVVSIYTLMNMPKAAKTGGQGQGDDLDMATLRANQPRLNSIIRESFGLQRIYPDYILPPFKRFVNYREQHNFLAMSVGVGAFDVPSISSAVMIGDTPISSFGGDVSARLAAPGESLAGDIRAEYWHVAPEVGGTNTGSGLDLASTMSPPASPEIVAVLASGKTLTAIGDADEWPSSWAVGMDVRIALPQEVDIQLNPAGRNRIFGDFADLQPSVGMRVTLSDTSEETDYVITVYEPAIPPVPGVGGSPSMITASSAPVLYDFTAAPATFVITYQTVATTITLNSDYINMSGLVAYITQELAGTGLVAQDHSGVLRITEPFSPYKGGVITGTALPVDAFGISPTYTTGTASSGGSAGRQAYVELRLPSGGAHVQWLPVGKRRVAIGREGFGQKITAIAGDLLTVERLTESGTVDTGWGGWATRYLDDEEIYIDADDPLLETSWLGPFMACPEPERTTRIEYDIFMPQGIGVVDKKGRNHRYTLRAELQWRDSAIGGAWTSVPWSLRYKSIDQIGVTLALDLPYPMRPEVRMRRTVQVKDDGKHRDQMHWYGLRARLTGPTKYDDVSVLLMRVRGGDRLSQQSENRVSITCTRKLNGAATRKIKDAVYYVCNDLGITSAGIDTDTINAISATWWEPRGETCDHQFSSAAAARDAIQSMLTAGMSHLTIKDAKISARREGVQSMPAQIISPMQMVEQLESQYSSVSPDDFEGVDVEFLNETSWSADTVQCRLPEIPNPRKIEKIKVDCVTNRTRAWRIGMRQLHKHRDIRWSYRTKTEMDALNCEYHDRISLTEDAVGYSQSALIEEVAGDLVRVSERIDWVDNPRVRVRRHDGTATQVYTPVRIDDYTMRIPGLDFVPDTSLVIEPCTLLFGAADKLEYPALVTEIDPQSDGTVSITAVEYTDNIYRDDDNEPA